VVSGSDYTIPSRDGGHTATVVYSQMLVQVAFDYKGLPDIRDLTARQIRFFYEGRRNSLKEETKPRQK